MSKPEFVVLDAETSIKNRGSNAIGKDKASPHYPDNKLLYLGYRNAYKKDVQIEDPIDTHSIFIDGSVLLVGHNIKFDMLYLLRNNRTRNNIGNIKIWDTQLAEYLLTGQEAKWASLGNKKDKDGKVIKQGLGPKYGGTDKDDRLAEYWDANIDTEDIPKDIIAPYLEDDVKNTELVAVQQMELAHELGMMPIIMAHMDALLATIEMEHNGLHFDRSDAMCELSKLYGELSLIEEALEKYYDPIAPYMEISYGSNDQLSALIFGGNLKYYENEEVLDEEGNVVLYKSGKNKGQPKTKKVQKTLVLPRKMVPKSDWVTKKAGVFKVDDEVLNELAGLTPLDETGLLSDLMIEYRRRHKEISTYYKPYVGLVFPDGCIHGKLNHCATHTGRLASSSPNLQNITNKEYEE